MSTVSKPELPDDAAAIWDAIAPPLIADGRLQPGDEYVFGELCRIRAVIATAQKRIDDEGIIIGGDGTGAKKQKNPALNVWRDMSSQAQRLEQRFGMTALARKQLGMKNRGTGLAGIAASLGD